MRSSSGTARPVIIRAAGVSDESLSSDSDGFDMPGFSKAKKKFNIPPPTMPQGSRPQPNPFTNGGGGDNDWEPTPTYGTAAEPVSKCEEARIACMRGDLDKLKELLDQGEVKIDAYFRDDNNPLLTASGNGHPDVVSFLLEKGADPNQLSKAGKISPLLAAVSCVRADSEKDVLEVCRLLLDKGAKVDAQDTYANSPLGIAIKRKKARREVAALLLERGADVDIPDMNRRTPIFYAAEDGDGVACRLLLEYDADIGAVEERGFTAYDVASEKGHLRLAELLYLARYTKWTPKDNPNLMHELTEDKARKKVIADGVSVKEDSQIETHLGAIGASRYMENFRKHKVSYVQFLAFTEQDLINVGIEEVGIRKKLLEGIREVHGVEWSPHSLSLIPQRKQGVTASETVCMLNNIDTHVKVIESSMQFLITRISQDPSALRFGKDQDRMKDIISLLSKVDKDNYKMEKKVLQLLKLLRSIKDNVEFKVGDEFELEPGELETFEKKWNALKDEKNRKGPGSIGLIGLGIGSALLGIWIVYRMKF